MPLFYVHLKGPAHRERDDIGIERDTLEAAYLDVYDAIPDIAAELMREGRDAQQHAFEITDAAGAPLLDVPFSERLREAPRRPRLQMTRSGGQVERAASLAASIQAQTDILRANMLASQQWMLNERDKRKAR